jgi:hypothetical protein
MVALFAFEFIEGNTITRLYFMRLRRLTREAVELGHVTPALEEARREHVPTFTHFLDIPILFVIVMLGAMRPNPGRFSSRDSVGARRSGVLTLVIPRLYPFELVEVGGDAVSYNNTFDRTVAPPPRTVNVVMFQ